MRSYKVSNSLRPYVRRRLKKSLHSCTMFQDADGNWMCQTNASSDTFRAIVEMAKSDKESEEIGIRIVPKSKINHFCYLEDCTAFAVTVLLDCYL